MRSTDANVKEQQKTLHLEQQAIAAADVLQQQQKHAETLEQRLAETTASLSDTEQTKHKLETQRVQLQAELHGLQAEYATQPTEQRGPVGERVQRTLMVPGPLSAVR